MVHNCKTVIGHNAYYALIYLRIAILKVTSISLNIGIDLAGFFID